MELKLYDTLTRQKRRFEPLERERVRVYLCGPTVYDFAHIGNARPNIIFDVLFRLLRHIYGADHVTYARNITDVDDKINARAAQEYPDRPLNEAIRTVTEATERQFHEDVDALGCLRPTVEPRATEHIDAMKLVIERLVASGNAYVAQEHVVFSVSSMPDYGKLSRRSLDEMMAGARVEVAPYKRDPMDFVLWKPSQPGEPAWPSPCGIARPGRPGWHIECSAMSWKHLGEMFDIHGGGLDLAFPHHENEIAQSRCAFHTPMMANYWMHNGFLQVEGEKMSKSLGNFVTIRELLQSWPGDVLRLNMLHTHYRQPIDWTGTGLNTARNELLSWSELIAGRFDGNMDFAAKAGAIDAGVLDALLDDLNTPLALSRLHHLFEAAGRDEKGAVEFARAASFLGFRHLTKPGFFHAGFARNLLEDGPQIGPEETRQIQLYRSAVANDLPLIADAAKHDLEAAGFSVQINSAGALFVGNKGTAGMADRGDDSEAMLKEKVQQLITLRAAARKARNFTEADRIRDELAAMGVVLQDSKEGTAWEIAR
jgi:cysteinyl-tRNA synthetase